MSEKIVSIEDVAKRAGFSISTVSRVTNDTGYPVAAATRKRILKVVEEMSYVPNHSAQSLRQESSSLIGLIVRDIADPYFGEIARGVVERGQQLGLMAFVCSTGRNMKNELEYHNLLWQHRVSGIIIAGGGLDSEPYRQILETQIKRAEDYGLKLVALAPQGVNLPYVMVDNVHVGSLMANYLIDMGHREVAFLGGPCDALTAESRLKGFVETINAKDTVLAPECRFHTDYSWQHGYEICKNLLKSGRGFTAVACASDNIAIGAMRALREEGRKIPDDVSVISVGDIINSQYTDPPLTTVHIPRYEMGVKAVDVIASDNKYDSDSATVFQARIVERNSVKNLSAAKK